MAWRDNLVPASFRGASFFVEAGAKSGGRRSVDHEYPKRDTPYAEDMGRKGRSFSVAAYVIGPNYTVDRDALELAMESEGPGLLILPTKGEILVQPGTFNSHESRERGGMCEFELSFMEAGSPGNVVGATATATNVQQQASLTGQASAMSLDQSLASIGSAGSVPLLAQPGGGVAAGSGTIGPASSLPILTQ